MPVDVVLINPGAQRRIFGPLALHQTAIEPPAWVRMITGWLRDNGYSASIIDQEVDDLSPAWIASEVIRQEARLAVIVVFGHQPSASTQQMTGAREVAMALYGKVPTIMVGNHPSALPVRTLKEEEITYVCDGEGPGTIKALLNGVPTANIPGLVWYDIEGNIHQNNRDGLIPIDELHGDVWESLPMDRYRAHNWQCFDGSPRQPYASIYTTLGCPFKCSFCMINVFQHTNRYRMRTPSSVVAQIKYLYNEYGVSTFKIIDEMFVLNDQHYTEICSRLALEPFAHDLNIWAYARVDTIKPTRLAFLRRAGVRWLALGIEAGSTYVRDGANKHLSEDDIREVVAEIQKAGINVLGNFIFGLPHDTSETMRDTFELAKSLNLEFANFYSAMAYPGSQLYGQTKPEDLPDTWNGYSQHSYETKPLPTETLTSADVLEFRDEAFHEFYTDPTYLELIDKKFGSYAVADIREMTKIRLPRKLLEWEKRV